MQSFVEILVYHPGGISDALLATPLANALKTNYPAARITWVCQPALSDLFLSFCPFIDEVIPLAQQAGYMERLKSVTSVKADLCITLCHLPFINLVKMFSQGEFVDLSLIDSDGHQVDALLAAAAGLCPERPANLFPTIFPSALTDTVVQELLPAEAHVGRLIALVPGVGRSRPQRAWIPEGWTYLALNLLAREGCVPVLVGGGDDLKTCQAVVEGTEGRCVSLAGKLSLVEAAALLKACDVVVAGDCGLLHLAVAVGAPVVGLFGATRSSRTGPYQSTNLTIDQSGRCQCPGRATCQNLGVAIPGECMTTIMLEEVLSKVDMALFDLVTKDSSQQSGL